MKRYLFCAAALLAALAYAAGCKMEEPEQAGMANAPQEVYQVHFVANEIETKTVFASPVESSNGIDYPTRWSGNEDKIAISVNLSGAKGATVLAAEDGKSAVFDADFSSSELEAPYVFYALSPFSACVGATSSHGGYHLNIPVEQTPLVSSCDESAQLLAASKTAESIDEFSSIEMDFTHVTAYGKLTLKNMYIPDNDSIQSIDITASVPFAGQFYYDFGQEALSESAASRTVTIRPDNLTLTEGELLQFVTYNMSDIWFACAPSNLGGGSITVVVNTMTGKLSRTVSIPEGRLSFIPGHVSKFTVNMAEAEFVRAQDRWVLVTNASELAAGDEVIIANSATAGSAYAMSTTQNTNNRGRVSVSIAQDSDGKMIIQNPGSSVEVIKLVNGDYTGFYRLQEGTSSSGRYLYTRNDTSTNNYNYLQSSTSPSNQGYANWKITVSDKAAIIATYQSYTKSKQTYYKQIRYNTASNSLFFAAYRSTSQTSWSNTVSGTGNVYIFRKEAGINTLDDPILEFDQYGAYLSNGNNIWCAGCQLSREYDGSGSVNFAIISPATYSIAEFNNIPADPAKGDTFTLNYSLITGRNQSDTDYNVTVVKVDGPKVWLSTGSGYGFIVKK